MKPFNFFIFLIIPFISASSAPSKNFYIAADIPNIHPDDNWMYGSISPSLPEHISPTFTTEYQEMLAKPGKKLLSLGLNNSGAVDLNSTVVIDDTGRYIYENDGVQGTIAAIRKPVNKLPLTEQYEQMLKDPETKMISLGVNSSALYDPDNQVIIDGTQDATPYDVLDKNFKEFEDEGRKNRRKMASFLNEDPRFLEKSDESLQKDDKTVIFTYYEIIFYCLNRTIPIFILSFWTNMQKVE